MISQKKHDRFLYTLLSIYTFLVMVFMLLLNGFFVNPKAIEIENTFDVNVQVTYNGNSGIGGRTFTKLNNQISKACIINDSHLISAFEDYNSIFTGGTVIAYRGVSIDNIPVNPNVGYGVYSVYDYETSTVPTYVSNFDSSYDEYMRFIWFPSQYQESTLPNSKLIQQVVENKSSIGYVNTLEDLKKYMKNGDDSVVIYDDPDNPQLPEDDSLPVPQKLGTDIQNDNVGTPPFISGSWENPSGIYASFDASEVQVEIQYKPVFQLYKKMFNLKLAKVSSSDWLPVTKTQISNYTVNRYILYNAKSGYPNPFDSQTIHSGSLTEDVETIGNSSGYTGMYNPISARIANGTNWRIRYVIGNKTSLWVVFHVNSIGSLKNEESVSFENASGDPVSAEDVNYTNSAQTETIDKLNVNNFFDSLSAAINGIFNTTNNSFTAQDTEGSKGFYAMFKATFEKFPVFWTFFCLGLIVAILLRILGR